MIGSRTVGTDCQAGAGSLLRGEWGDRGAEDPVVSPGRQSRVGHCPERLAAVDAMRGGPPHGPGRAFRAPRLPQGVTSGVTGVTCRVTSGLSEPRPAGYESGPAANPFAGWVVFDTPSGAWHGPCILKRREGQPTHQTT